MTKRWLCALVALPLPGVAGGPLPATAADGGASPKDACLPT